MFVVTPINGFATTFFSNTNFYLHIMCPILSLLLFLSINVDHKIKVNRIFLSTVPILFYTIVYIINVYLIGEDNGGWFDHYYIKNNFSLWQIVCTALIVAVTVAFILLFIHNSQHKKYKNLIRENIKEYKNIGIIEAIKRLTYEQRKQYKEGDIIVPVHIVDIMQKEYGENYTNEELYKIYLDNFMHRKYLG